MIEGFSALAARQASDPVLELVPTRAREAPAAALAEAPSVLSLPERVRSYEIGLIREALARAGGNQSEAARLLGVPRRTLAHKVLSYGLLRSRRPAARKSEPSEP
jgi:DNA-binding NtrC family response regulator